MWGAYAKDRYDLQERRRAEFRGSARQLASVIPAVIGIEIATVGRFIPAIGSSTLYGWSLFLFGAALLAQSILLVRAIRAGFGGEKHRGPESPVVLWNHVSGKDKAEVLRVISAYYAKSADELHTMNERLISSIKWDAIIFALSLLVVAYIPAVAIAASPARKETSPMPTHSENAPSQPSEPRPAPPSDNAPAAPSPSSPMNTPTPGQLDTAGAKPPEIL